MISSSPTSTFSEGIDIAHFISETHLLPIPGRPDGILFLYGPCPRLQTTHVWMPMFQEPYILASVESASAAEVGDLSHEIPSLAAAISSDPLRGIRFAARGPGFSLHQDEKREAPAQLHGGLEVSGHV